MVWFIWTWPKTLAYLVTVHGGRVALLVTLINQIECSRKETANFLNPQPTKYSPKHVPKLYHKYHVYIKCKFMITNIKLETHF